MKKSGAKLKAEDLIFEARKRWSAPIVASQKITEFTGGVLSCPVMANLDFTGKDPDGKLHLRRTVVYPADSLTY